MEQIELKVRVIEVGQRPINGRWARLAAREGFVARTESYVRFTLLDDNGEPQLRQLTHPEEPDEFLEVTARLPVSESHAQFLARHLFQALTITITPEAVAA